MTSRLVALLGALLPLALAAAPALAQTSYPLTCRGGGYMSIANDGSGGVYLSFRPAAGAVPLGLQPGECSWSDRALRGGEPSILCDSAASAVGYVQQLLQDSQYVIFQVYNDALCLRVARVGP